VLTLFMALLSFRGISTPSLPAQGGQRRFSYFNIQRGNPQIVAAGTKGTIAGGFRKEGDAVVEIVRRSGEVQFVTYSTGTSRPPIWPKLKNLVYPGDIARFMSKWGAIDQLPGARVDYVRSVDTLLPMLARLKQLIEFVESNDRDGFLGALGNRTVFHGTLKADSNSGHLLGEVTGFAMFLVLEMWLDFGGDRPSSDRVKTCVWCHRPFRAGGRRTSTALRADATYCSKSCRNMASRARVRRSYTSADPA
jgi:hypothetical protein